jgi:cob(I)alamin adenosyltransferase
MNNPDQKRGLVLVYTGDGKGKTTAALGLALRALGRGKRVLIVQFIKSPTRPTGEKIMFERLGVDIYQTGIGFTWTKTPEEHREALRNAWEFTKEQTRKNTYDLVILDEINNALAIDSFPVDDVLPLPDVLNWIEQRPHGMHLVLTGRAAKDEIIEISDLVTEMKPIKHYYDQGIPAVIGIEL